MTLFEYADLVERDDFEATPLLSPGTGEPGVALTTLHQAKGTEFDVVFIADAIEGRFPDLRRSRSLIRSDLLSRNDPSDPEGIEFRLQEEMRLAYTTMTRARRRVIWTATAAGVDEAGGRPSRFLLAAAGARSSTELPPARRQTGPPVSTIDVERQLRRMLVDPQGPAGERLAAATVLAHPPGAFWDPSMFAGVMAPGSDRGVVGESFSLSPSQAESYATCPRLYRGQRCFRVGCEQRAVVIQHLFEVRNHPELVD
jgi:ATP-dependent exoDNAse (exonuclease V) beta subunit